MGLQKIKETEVEVKELQKSLHLKSQELEAKNAAANAKLKQMVCFCELFSKDLGIRTELWGTGDSFGAVGPIFVGIGFSGGLLMAVFEIVLCSLCHRVCKSL